MSGSGVAFCQVHRYSSEVITPHLRSFLLRTNWISVWHDGFHTVILKTLIPPSFLDSSYRPKSPDRSYFLYINGFAIDAAYLCLLLLRTIWQVKNTGHVVINELCDSWWNLSWVCFFILPHGPITRDINNGPSISITSPCKAIWNLEWTDLVSARLIYRIKIRTPPGSASSIKSEPKGLTPVFNHQIPIWSALFLSLYNLSHHRLQGSHNRHDF